MANTGEKSEEQEKPSEGFKKFQKAMKGYSDDVSKLLSTHLVVEHFLEQTIIASIPRGDILITDGHLNFSTKLTIVRSLDNVSDYLCTSIKHLNTVRNHCSHSLDYRITDADIDLIGRPFGKEYQEFKDGHEQDILRRILMAIVARLEFSYELVLKEQKKA